MDRWLLLEYQRRSAHALTLEVDYHFDTVCDLHQRDSFIHPIILAVEGHGPLNFARARPPLPGKRKRQLLRFGHSAYREVADIIKRVRTGLYNLRRVKCDHGIVLDDAPERYINALFSELPFSEE